MYSRSMLPLSQDNIDSDKLWHKQDFRQMNCESWRVDSCYSESHSRVDQIQRVFEYQVDAVLNSGSAPGLQASIRCVECPQALPQSLSPAPFFSPSLQFVPFLHYDIGSNWLIRIEAKSTVCFRLFLYYLLSQCLSQQRGLFCRPQS